MSPVKALTSRSSPLTMGAVLLATQYFRPPFPDRSRWASDLQQIAAAGLTHVYVWASWGWIEPAPEKYVFDDYDELFELVRANGLQVVVNAIAELQPAWIHRVVPGAELVDHTGRRVDSSTLAFSNTGIMPGGCLDHPEVAARSGRFLLELARRYRDEPALVAWDAWSELRWASQSDGYVCYCDRTLGRFHQWLQERHGDLDRLNRAWHRRFTDWSDVRPGRRPGRSYTELVEFQAFLTTRTAALLRERCAQLRVGDPTRPVVAHTALPATFFTGAGSPPFEQALARGNDWELAESLDAFGCSLFPTWFAMTPADFGARIESGRSAARDAGRPYWVAELQGGSHRHGIEVTPPLTGAEQQRWVWNGYSRGSKAVNFWCWRDEVIGCEASGFGIVGDDGFAGDRVAALRRTATVVRDWSELLDGYEPEPGAVGVVFVPSAYQLDWAQAGPDCDSAGPSLHGYLRALERSQLPYRVVEASHPGRLDELRLIIVPWALVIPPELGAALTAWVRAGGRLVIETETDAYDPMGFYHYPDERPFANGVGIRGTGRRPADGAPLTVRLDGVDHPLRTASWVETLEPEAGTVLAAGTSGVSAVAYPLGSGEVIALGSHVGLAYERAPYAQFEVFVAALVRRAGIEPSWRASEPDGDLLQWRFGWSAGVPLLFMTNAGPDTTATLTARVGLLGARTHAVNLADGTRHRVRGGVVSFRLARDAWQVVRFD